MEPGGNSGFFLYSFRLIGSRARASVVWGGELSLSVTFREISRLAGKLPASIALGASCGGFRMGGFRKGNALSVFDDEFASGFYNKAL